MFPFLVIDQNQFRNKAAIERAASRCKAEGLQLLIPDGAGFEMSKSSVLFDTWLNSLKLLCPYSGLIVVSKKMTELMRAERATGQCSNSLTDSYATARFREILVDLHHGNQESLRLVTDTLHGLIGPSLDIWSDFDAIKGRVVTMRDCIKKALSDEDVKGLRKSPESAIANWLSSDLALQLTFQGIALPGANQNSAVRLASFPSVTGAFATSMIVMALHWLAVGGLETAKAEKVTNDMHDLEYAVLGTLSLEVISSDKRLMAIQKAVRIAQTHRHNWFKEKLAHV